MTSHHSRYLCRPMRGCKCLPCRHSRIPLAASTPTTRWNWTFAQLTERQVRALYKKHATRWERDNTC